MEGPKVIVGKFLLCQVWDIITGPR